MRNHIILVAAVLLSGCAGDTEQWVSAINDTCAKANATTYSFKTSNFGKSSTVTCTVEAKKQ